MHKYLETGAATWTASTRTIAGAVMSPVFSADDQTYGRQLFFKIGANLYHGTVQKYVSATSVILYPSGSLPLSSGSIDTILLYEYPGTRTYNDYINRIQSMVKDSAPRLSTEDGGDVDRIFSHCVSIYSKHNPHTVKMRIQGNGTGSYPISSTLGSLWTKGISKIQSIEYPVGTKPPDILDSEDYEVYDDGTAVDGSNLALRFEDITPGATEYFVVEFSVQRSVPKVGLQNFPDNDQHFSAITMLSASYMCAALAASYAQSIDKAINLDAVNYEDKSRKYMELSRMYYKHYKLLVFGNSDDGGDVQAAIADKEISIEGATGSGFLFH